jgi:hypothetical protein
MQRDARVDDQASLHGVAQATTLEDSHKGFCRIHAYRIVCRKSNCNRFAISTFGHLLKLLLHEQHAQCIEDHQHINHLLRHGP